MTVRAVIFDIDGTLVDSVDLHARAWRDAFLEFGRDVPLGTVRNQIGKGGDQLLPVFFSKDEIKRYGEELTEFRGKLYKRAYLPEVKAFPKVRELFERVLSEKKRIALGSSAKEDELEAYVKLTNIGGLIEVATSADDAERSKPHPDIFHAALEQLGSPEPRDVIVVGDSPYDAMAANRAGLRAIGVRCGGFGDDDLRDAGCLEIHDDPAAILAGYDVTLLARG
jgi:HAD superfamily hydrolase (TIGR01549 family)